MRKLKEAQNTSFRLDLAKALTLAILERVAPQQGLGAEWGKQAAAAFEACFDGIGELEVD